MDSGFFDDLKVGERLAGEPDTVTRETIRAFAQATLDFNALHLDDVFMSGENLKDDFGGVISHGMNTFALITRMLVDWLEPRGGEHRRLETRWLHAVRPGDTILASAQIVQKQETASSRWIVLDIEVHNQTGQQVASGQAMAEFASPRSSPGTSREGQRAK